MSAKLSYETVYKYFKDEGCELLEKEYINLKTKMRYRCECGEESSIRFYDFKSGHRCAKCYGNEKHKFEDVYNKFKEKGCELLETAYINAHTKMKYRCSCNNESSIKFNDFQNGNRCMKCSGKEKLTYEDVYNYFIDQGCKLLDTEYINNKTEMKYICECGNESVISFARFQQNGRCKECGIKKRACENHPHYNTDRTRPRRVIYLSFDYQKLHILKDDPNYTNHIQSKKSAKASGNRWDKSHYTVDHIQPRVAFIDNDLDNIYGQTVVKKICNLRENLRIIPKKDNESKGGRYNQEEFMTWFNEKINLYNLKENINANRKDYAINKSVGCCNN